MNTRNSKVFVLPAGRYYVGDPCYCFAHTTTTWSELLEQNEYFDTEVTELKPGKTVVGFSTAYGDGTYNSSIGKLFMVDAGLIGVVHEDLIETGSTFDENDDCGLIVEFKRDFNVYSTSDGVITIGHIYVYTGDEGNDPYAMYEEDYEYED